MLALEERDGDVKQAGDFLDGKHRAAVTGGQESPLRGNGSVSAQGCLLVTKDVLCVQTVTPPMQAVKGGLTDDAETVALHWLHAGL